MDEPLTNDLGLRSDESVFEGRVDPNAVEGPDSSISEGLVTELVRLRKKQKIGQEGIAKAIGTTQSRVSQFENMKGSGMTLDAFVRYAETIGVKVVMIPVRSKKRSSG